MPEHQAKDDAETIGSKSWLWLVLTITVIVVAACVPLLFKHGYYYVDDSETSYFGRFYHYGEMLLQGNWPLLNPGAWRSGDYIVESSWGLFSPIMMILAIGATVVSNAALYMTAMKVLFLAVFGAGTFTLARSFRVSPAAACVAGIAVPLAGFTMYMDAPSWSVGLMASAMLTWTWWGIRRLTAGGNPAAALLFGFLLIGLGYISMTLALALLVLAHLFEASLRRDWRTLARLGGLGLCFTLVVLTVNLPGYLSADVTARGNMAIRNVGQQVADAAGFFSASLPTAIAGVKGFWGPVLEQPMMYISWLLPLLALLDWSRVRESARGLASLWFMLTAATLWVLGPSNLGPVRVQMRLMPVVALCTVLVLVVLLDRARAAHLGRGRLWPMSGAVLVAGYLTFSQRPQSWHPVVIGVLAVALGLFVVWLLARRTPGRPGLPASACVFVAVWSICLVALQHHYYPRSPGPDLGMPSTTAAMKTQLPEAVGDTFVVGDVTGLLLRRPEASRWLLLANTWYVNPARVQNLYSAIGYRTYNSRYCLKFHGDTCPEALDTLFTEEPMTGLQRVDLLSVSTVVVRKPVLEHTGIVRPPLGWHQVAENPVSVTWVRDDPLPPSGGVVWMTPQADIEVVHRSNTRVSLSVKDVPDRGADVVLSRLDWPGYGVEGASFASPVDDYLLTVHVPASSQGKIVDIRFRPPGWEVVTVTGLLGIAGGAVWSMLALRRVRRRSREHPATAVV